MRLDSAVPTVNCFWWWVAYYRLVRSMSLVHEPIGRVSWIDGSGKPTYDLMSSAHLAKQNLGREFSRGCNLKCKVVVVKESIERSHGLTVSWCWLLHLGRSSLASALSRWFLTALPKHRTSLLTTPDRVNISLQDLQYNSTAFIRLNAMSSH